MKTWDPIDMTALGSAKSYLKTSWREGKIYYIFTFTPYNRKIKAAESNSWSSFSMSLLDKNAFCLFSKEIPLSSMTNIVDNNGKEIAITFSGNDLCTAEKYRSFSRWDVSWRF